VNATARKRILFVDDETSVLSLLQAVCRRIGPEWEVAFAESGAKALQLLDEQPFDVVVSDMRMPQMNGVELLNEVMVRSPRTARIILSGYADQQMVLRSLGATHQYLTKPCDIAALRSTIQRIMALDRFLNSEKLKLVLGRIQTLPSLPSLYFKLMKEMASPDATTDSIAALVSEDISLTAKLLQLTNSAFFGVPTPVTSAKEAVQILGFSTVKTLALSIYVFSRFDPDRMPGFPTERLWRHSMATGLLARRIAAGEKADFAAVEASFTAGILHDLGKLVFGFAMPELYRLAVERAAEKQILQAQAETEIIGAGHPEAGAYLLGLWGLPPSIVEAVAWHHAPCHREPKEFSALAAVHIAEHVHSRQTPLYDPPFPAPIDNDYLAALNLSAKLRTWTDNPA
jgi:HD-like signal output (HDOD) protein/CheY-like chemotaxis protein